LPRGCNLALDLGIELIARNLEVIVLREAEPGFGRGAKVPRQPERGFARDAAPAFEDLGDAIGGNVQLISELVHAHAERLEEFLAQNFAG